MLPPYPRARSFTPPCLLFPLAALLLAAVLLTLSARRVIAPADYSGDPSGWGPSSTPFAPRSTAIGAEQAPLPSLTPSGHEPSAAALSILDPSPFAREVVDFGPKAGLYASLARSSSGQVAILYADDQLDQVKLAWKTGAGWQVSALPSGGLGLYTALQFDPNGSAIAAFYRPEDNALLCFFQRDQKWLNETVAEGVKVAGLSLALDSQGLPAIAYLDAESGMLRLARRDWERWQTADVRPLPAPETPGETHFSLAASPHGLGLLLRDPQAGLLYAAQGPDGGWAFDVIEAGADAGYWPSLAFDATGAPRAAYTVLAPKPALKYAALDGARWRANVIDPVPATAITLRSSGQATAVAYLDGGTRLKYARLLASGIWQAQIVDQAVPPGSFVSLDLAADGPAIAYYSVASRLLRYAALGAGSNSGALLPAALGAIHSSGQTFLTWAERPEMQGEVYRLYRSAAPIDPAGRSTWTYLGETGKYSSRFFAASYHPIGDYTHFTPRYVDGLVVPGGAPLPPGAGLFAWTVRKDAFAPQPAGKSYYALTVTPPGGAEQLLAATLAPVEETTDDPLPVEITDLSRVRLSHYAHAYIQYMDVSVWNATFHAPNPANHYLGYAKDDPNLPHALAYAYDYALFDPDPEQCGGFVPDRVPVVVNLHGWRDNRYNEVETNPNPYCAYVLLPVDQSETWYFGFARYHDYRLGGTVAPGDVIANFTEQRVLRMIYDLERRPPGPLVDDRRIYLVGHSMGGTGALALAERYPNVFAAAYSSQPMTNFRTAGTTKVDWTADVALKWGAMDLNLPIFIDAPAALAAPLQKYSGKVGVWDWQNLIGQLSARPADEMALISVDHGLPDPTIPWASQGAPLYVALDASLRPYAGTVTGEVHSYSDFHSLPPWMALLDTPFANLNVVRDESVPAISSLSANPPLPPNNQGKYNAAVLWSSSWNRWHGKPVDAPDRWQVALCSAKPGSHDCGGPNLTASITPRRLQKFKVRPGAAYHWEARSLADQRVLASGTVRAEMNGLLTVPQVPLTGVGVELTLTP